MHDHDIFFHTHDGGHEDEATAAVAKAILDQETLELLTVGIDIGSSTAHLIFARVFFQREGYRSADRFVAIDRKIIWRSPIIFTPFLRDGTIDAQELFDFVENCYAEAGLSPDDVDSGAVILTGEAIKRANARAIDEVFAAESGKFVCATAGHKLESTLAAHGSGATQLSKARGQVGLHVDIGGGTTKMALISDGRVIDVAAFAVGGRLIAQDAQGAWTRVDDSARLVAEELGIKTDPATLAEPEARARIADRLAEVLVNEVIGGPADALAESLELTERLARTEEPDYLTFSGGVAEYFFGQTRENFGDIASELAQRVVERLSTRASPPLVDPGQGIRATVIGASQFTVQVSGTTMHLSGEINLPIQNIPVVPLAVLDPSAVGSGELVGAVRARAERRDADLADPVCLAVRWTGSATYQRLLQLGHVIADVSGRAADPASLLVIVIDADIAQLLGRVLREDLGVVRSLVVVDGIELNELDYVDVGALIDPPGVVPVVIKSLLFE